jgi:uncharacterized repeat protein (TIGR03847 family)
MSEASNDYGRASSVEAGAIGEPGQRRFRLVVIAGSQRASIWMEKQQLGSIGEWFKEMCERLDGESPRNEPDILAAPTPLNFDLDFRVRQLGLGYLEEDDLFVLHAFDIAGDISDPLPTFRCMINRGQARVLAREIERVVAGGRPICPLCESPMDPGGHVCPRSNGHHAAASV